MADYLLYTTTIDGVRSDNLYNVQTRETLDLSTFADLGIIAAHVPNEGIVAPIFELGGNLATDGFAHIDLRTGQVEIIPEIEGFSYQNQAITPFADGYFIAGHEPIFFRPGEGAKLLAELNTTSSPSGLDRFSSPENAVPFGDGILFTADNGTSQDLYFQGDPDNTVPVILRGMAENGEFSLGGADITDGIELNGKFIFLGGGIQGTTPFYGAYATDGTADSVEELTDARLFSVSRFEEFDGFAYFTARSNGVALGTSIWRTDGTASGTQEIATADTFEAASPLAGLSDEEGGIRDNSTMTAPIVVGDKMYVIVLADTDLGRSIQPMIFEILPNGTVEFNAEADLTVFEGATIFNRSFAGTDILTYDTLAAGPNILVPGLDDTNPSIISLYAVNPETGGSTPVVDALRGPVYDNDVYQPYGEDGVIFFDRGGAPTVDPNIIVTDGTLGGTYIVDNDHDANVPDGVGRGFGFPDNRFTFVSNDTISWENNFQLVVTDQAGNETQVIFDERDYPGISAGATSRGLFEGPDNLFDIFQTLVGRQREGTSDLNVFLDGLGNDIIDGKGGQDQIVYGSPSTDYTVTLMRDGTVTVLDREGRGGLDILTSVEIIKFADRDIDLENFSSSTLLTNVQMTEIAKVYAAYFNRAPDATGLFFWADKFAEGLTLEAMAEFFFDQEETRALYPNPGDTETFVTSIYANVLGRVPDGAGFDFWSEQLALGNVTQGSFVLEIIRGAQGPDISYLQNKAELGVAFSALGGLSDVSGGISVFEAFGSSERADLDLALQTSSDLVTAASQPGSDVFVFRTFDVVDDPFAVA